MSGLLKYLVRGLIQNNATANWFVVLHFLAARLSPYRDGYVLVTYWLDPRLSWLPPIRKHQQDEIPIRPG
jgi:hypothetical protein